MALPSSLGDYTKWDSTDILNRFKDGCKPTVEDWEAIRPYLFPMQFLIMQMSHTNDLKTCMIAT